MNQSQSRITSDQIKNFIEDVVIRFQKADVFRLDISDAAIVTFKKDLEFYLVRKFAARKSYEAKTLLHLVEASDDLAIYYRRPTNSKSPKKFQFKFNKTLTKTLSFVLLAMLVVATIISLVFTLLTDSAGLLMLAVFLFLISGLGLFYSWKIYYGNRRKKATRAESLPLGFKVPILFFLAALFLGLYYYVVLPPLSLQSASFIVFLMLALLLLALIGVYIGHTVLLSRKKSGKYSLQKFNVLTVLSVIGVTILYSLAGTLSSVDLFRASDLASLLKIEKAENSQDFDEDFKYLPNSTILPILDSDLAFRQAEFALGAYGDQYYINQTNSSVLSVDDQGKEKMLWVAPLEYLNLFISLQRNSLGTPGYVTVDMVTGETILRDEHPLVYTVSAKMGADLARHIRLHNLTVFYDHVYFEIDDNFVPYWIIPCYQRRIVKDFLIKFTKHSRIRQDGPGCCSPARLCACLRLTSAESRCAAYA